MNRIVVLDNEVVRGPVAKRTRSVLEQLLQSGPFEACRMVPSVALRMRGEFQRSGTIAPGRERYKSGLRDRSADFRRFWKLISIAELAAPLAVERLYVQLLAEASLPSLCH
jgi:hypothetical protein